MVILPTHACVLFCALTPTRVICKDAYTFYTCNIGRPATVIGRCTELPSPACCPLWSSYISVPSYYIQIRSSEMEQQLSDLVSDGVNLYEEGMLGYNRAGGTDDHSYLDVDILV